MIPMKIHCLYKLDPDANIIHTHTCVFLYKQYLASVPAGCAKCITVFQDVYILVWVWLICVCDFTLFESVDMV